MVSGRPGHRGASVPVLVIRVVDSTEAVLVQIPVLNMEGENVRDKKLPIEIAIANNAPVSSHIETYVSVTSQHFRIF